MADSKAQEFDAAFIESLLRSNQALKKSHKNLNDFIYILVHDLKQPLRTIHSYSRFVLEDNKGKLGAQSTQELLRVNDLAEKMKSQLDTLFFYAEIENSKIMIRAEKISDMTQAAKEELRSEFPEPSNIHIVSNVAPGLNEMNCDKRLMTQVFFHLIKNAIQYNDKPKKLIDIGVRRESSGREYYVRDNGIGFEDQYKENIFTLFRRLHQNNEYGEGLGAGLTIVKKIIEQHGGRIRAESEAGKGSIFYFSIG